MVLQGDYYRGDNVQPDGYILMFAFILKICSYFLVRALNYDVT